MSLVAHFQSHKYVPTTMQGLSLENGPKASPGFAVVKSGR
jgi:hypothetical protein